MLVSGRLRAAMIRAGKRANYAVLKQMLEQAGNTINRQTVHNWFKPSCQFIDQAWLFKIAGLLDVNPEWLATGEGDMARPTPISDLYAQVLGVLNDLPSEEARTKWLRDGESLAKLLNKKGGKSAPFDAVTATHERAKRTT